LDWLVPLAELFPFPWCSVSLSVLSARLWQDLEQKLCLQEQDAAVIRNMKSELLRLPRMERELKRLREENAHLR
jgi:cell shape-determining protein MreC